MDGSQTGRARSGRARGAVGGRAGTQVLGRRAVPRGHQRGGRPRQAIRRHRQPQVRECRARRGRTRAAPPRALDSQAEGAVAQSEFEVIARYFSRLGAERADVRLGVGDDGAVLAPPAARELVVVTDTLVDGVHFPPRSPPSSIGHRAFAVNLSDIAAMGAEPAWALLALTLPGPDDPWLQEFARAAGDLCRRHGVALVGGDTTRGPLSMTVTLIGTLPVGTALQRRGGGPGRRGFLTRLPGGAPRRPA